MRRLLAISTIRSDYDLMSGLYRLLDQDAEIDLKLLVAGAHLSHNFGYSVNLIRKDGFDILAEIENLIDSDSIRSRLKTASVFLQNAVDIVWNWNPELILYAGDREDVLVGGMLGTYLNIPTAHFFGGDHERDGHSDTVVRHATSKLSTVHFVSIEEHRQRLISMGESPDRIFVIGNIALDKFIHSPSWEKEDIFLRIPEGKQLEGYALVIYHPVDQEREIVGENFINILDVLLDRGIPAIVSYPNSDPGNHFIVERIRQYESNTNVWCYKNLDRDFFISIFKNCRFLIGNSSAGIMEAASVPVAAINVGERQRGRFAGENVVFCDPDYASIDRAVTQVLSSSFQQRVKLIANPYGDGYSCNRAFEIIKQKDFRQIRLKIEDPLDLHKNEFALSGVDTTWKE